MSLLKCNSRSNSSVESLKTSLFLFTLPYQTRASWSIHGVQKLKALETDTLARREACRRDGIEGSVITPHPLNFHKRPLSDRRRQYVNSTYPECRQLVAFFSIANLYRLYMNVVFNCVRWIALAVRFSECFFSLLCDYIRKTWVIYVYKQFLCYKSSVLLVL